MSASFAGRMRLSGFPSTVTVHDKDGNLVAPPPTPTTAQQWIAAALDDEDIADLLTFFGRADNWFDLYKTIEMAEKLDGSKHTLERKFPKIGSTRTTANFYRHAPRSKHSYLPPNAPSFSEAYAVVRAVVSAVLYART